MVHKQTYAGKGLRLPVVVVLAQVLQLLSFAALKAIPLVLLNDRTQVLARLVYNTHSFKHCHMQYHVTLTVVVVGKFRDLPQPWCLP
jgi:hypothetical protein